MNPSQQTDATDVEARRFKNLHTQEGRTSSIRIHDLETSHGFTTTRTLTASTLLNRLHQMARTRSGVSIPITPSQYKNRGNHLSYPIWHYQSLTTTSLPLKTCSNSDANTGPLKTKSIGSEILFSGRTLHKQEQGISHKSWQHYATPLCLFYALRDIQKSLKQYDASLQNLYSQLNLLGKES